MSTPSSPRPALTRVADSIVDILVRHGIDTAFGVPGGAISPIVDALAHHPDIEMVPFQNETNAVLAATAYAAAAGRPAAVFVTSGPGVLSAVNGMASARCEGLPVVVLAGEVATPRMGRVALQDGSPFGLDVPGIARKVCKHAVCVLEPNAAPAQVDWAVRHSQSGRPGPVLVSLPIDVTSASALAPRLELAGTQPARAMPLPHDGPVAEDLVRILLEARRPLLLAGAGCKAPGVQARLVALAERMQAPVATTPKGKGTFPESHPLSLGVFGYGGHPSAMAHLEEPPDVLLVLGSRLSDVATNGSSPALVPTRALVHVDIDAGVFGQTYATHLAVQEDVAQVLDLVLDRTVGFARPARTYGVNRLVPAPHGPAGMSPGRIIEEVQRRADPDTIFCSDIGDHFLFATHYLRTDRPDQFYVQTGLGSMGCGLTSAIGLARARPDRRVVAFVGDGGFLVSSPELLTVARELLNITVVVLNDQRQGMVERGHTRLFGRRPSFSTGMVTPFALSAGLGVPCYDIRTPADFDEYADAIRSGGVINVLVDPDIALTFDDRFEKFADEQGGFEIYDTPDEPSLELTLQ